MKMNCSTLKSFWFTSGKLLFGRRKKAIKIIFNETHVSNFKYGYLYFDIYVQYNF